MFFIVSNLYIYFYFQKWLTDFYKGAPDMIAFSKTWKQSVTYQEKIKVNFTHL